VSDLSFHHSACRLGGGPCRATEDLGTGDASEARAASHRVVVFEVILGVSRRV
jgi:hypothetical protein